MIFGHSYFIACKTNPCIFMRVTFKLGHMVPSSETQQESRAEQGSSWPYETSQESQGFQDEEHLESVCPLGSSSGNSFIRGMLTDSADVESFSHDLKFS